MNNFLVSAALFSMLVSSVFAAPAAGPLTPPQVFARAKTLHVLAVRFQNGVEKEVSEAWLTGPNKAYVEDTDRQVGGITVVYASDGKTQTEYRKSRSQYTHSAAPARIADIETHALALSVLTDFYTSAQFAQFKPGAVDATLSSYFLPLGEQEGHGEWEVLTVDRKTGLPQAVYITSRLPDTIPGSDDNDSPKGREKTDPQDQRIEFHYWELNKPVSPRRFAYAPPAGAKLYVPPKLLANGTSAPDFTVQDKDGQPVKLSDFRGKIVVLDFWATWCVPCQMSLPHTTQVAGQYAAKDVVVLAVNVWDTQQAFEAWLPKHPQYHILHFAIRPGEDRDTDIAGKLYGVSGIPTQYVIGKDGRIVRSMVGYEPGSHALEDALEAAGAQ